MMIVFIFEGRPVDFIENTRFGIDRISIQSITGLLFHFVDDRHRAMNWLSIFPFHDQIILKNLKENPNFLLDFDVLIDNHHI